MEVEASATAEGLIRPYARTAMLRAAVAVWEQAAAPTLLPVSI